MLTDSSSIPIEKSDSDHSASSLAGMLLLTALAYALPFSLYPATHPFNGPTSPEILNLNFMVGWMGLAHFIYAYYGQAKALSRDHKKIAPYLGLLIVGVSVLLTLRHFLGYMLFSFLMWIYFLPHFVRAEILFTNTPNVKSEVAARPGVYIFPALAFAFFTFALFGPVEFISNRWNLILLAEATLGAGFALGLVRQLKDKQLSIYALLAVALIAEGMVWATYRQYMVFQFQQGIYVFHIAMASFYHYLRSYGYARRMGTLAGTPMNKLFLPGILAVNLSVIAIAYILANYFADAPTRFVFDVSYFTFWVGLHQYASDVFNCLKRSPIAQASSNRALSS